MIPLSSQEGVTVPYTDNDGIVYNFLPQTGLLENEFFELLDLAKDQRISPQEYSKREKEFFDKVLKNINTKGKYEIKTEKLSDLFTSVERGKIFGFWHRASALSVEEKKS